MLPETFIINTAVKNIPSKTYKIDWENNTISGFIDGKDALEESIELAITTERYMWDVYSWNYGSELYTLIGKNDAYAMSEMKRMIQDALLPDSRITNTSDFVFTKIRGGLECSFKADTTVGEVNGKV